MLAGLIAGLPICLAFGCVIAGVIKLFQRKWLPALYFLCGAMLLLLVQLGFIHLLQAHLGLP